MNILQHPLNPNTYFHDPAVRPPTVQTSKPAGVGQRVIEGVLLHFTVGTTSYGAFATFQGSPKTLGYPESVPFLVDPSGDIWQLHDEAAGWGYHLGCSDFHAQNHRHDRRLIGIEIVNIGPLWLGHDGDSLVWNGGRTVYGKLSDPNCPPHIKLPTPYRGVQYFASMTPAQIAATVELVDALQKRWMFPRVIPPLERGLREFVTNPVAGRPSIEVTTHATGMKDCRFAMDLDYFAGVNKPFCGVATHTEFRMDKFDLCPAYNEIYDGLSAAGFTESV